MYKKTLYLVSSIIVLVIGIYLSLLGGILAFGSSLLAIVSIGGILATFAVVFFLIRKGAPDNFSPNKFATRVLIGIILLCLLFFGFFR